MIKFCLSRRLVGVGLGLALAALLLGPARAEEIRVVQPDPRPSHGFEKVVEKARALAAAPFAASEAPLPEALTALRYDDYRSIRFRPDKALLQSGRFRMQLFHTGFLFNRPVKVNVVRHGGFVRPVRFSADLFDYGGNAALGETLTAAAPELAFAGLRLHYPLNDPTVIDELAVFQGASYFRMLGRGQAYGISARGLAIDTGRPTGEEFPFFREFWVLQPEPQQDHIELHALLDSPSVAGAYRFVIYPGEPSVAEITAELFPRQPIAKLGIAPLTSMFWHGEMKRRGIEDFRPEVHDSDGLMIHTGQGEWLWRPLRNPRQLAISAFMDGSPRGFGLLQRDRDFGNYQDLEAHYERRPSYWIEPLAGWGAGHVELVEIPTPDETNDNIVAYWVPEAPVTPGAPISVHYRLTAALDTASLHKSGRAVATRQAPPAAIGAASDMPAEARRFIVDFAGGDLAYYAKAAGEVTAVATASRGQIVRSIVQANPAIGGVRAMFDFVPEPGAAADLRLFLKAGDRALTETWTLPWAAGDE